MRSHNEGAEGRGESERVHERNTHGHCHRQTELRIECTGGSAHKAYRDEHGHKHECSSDKGCRNASHRVYRRLVCGFVSFVKLGLHSLHDHDGVIHHSTDHQHECEECDHIETESCNKQEGESTHERYDDRNRRDDCRAETLEEDEHHEDNEENRLEESLDHVPDGCVKEVLGTHKVHDLQTLREVCADPFHLSVHCLDDLVGVGA